MASRAVYPAEFLLQLQRSPLVVRPPKLPPIDEWMGPPETRTQQRPAMARPKTDDGAALFDEGFKTRDKRPGGMDGRSRTSIPEDIVLGPPTTQFASASKNNGQFGAFKKTFFEEEAGKTYREKPTRERAGSERDGDKSTDSRGLNGRRGKEDTEGWTSVKSRKNLSGEEPERNTRQQGERDTKSGTYKERFPRSFDSQEGAEAEKKNGFSRAQESSWFRAETKTKDTANGDLRERNWRDKAPAKTEWGRGSKTDSYPLEKEPEWLEADFEEEKKPAKSMEEFQRWREKMKAANSSTDIPKVVEEPEKPEPEAKAVESAKDQDIVFDSTSDGFFSLWGQKKPPAEALETAAPLGLPTQPSRGSRFNRFFSSQENTPKTQEPPKLPPQPLATAPAAPINDKGAEEREAFQRVLRMLGSTGGGGISLSGPSPVRQDEARRQEASAPPGIFGLPQPNEFPRNSREEARPLTSGQGQAAPRPQNDEFFFRLMGQNARQAQLDHNQPQSPDRGPMQGRQNMPPGNLGLLDDLGMSNFQRRFQGEQGRQDMPNERQGQEPLQRPPGLSFVPPGWPPGLPPPNPNSRQMAPPPGFNDRSGGMPPPGFYNQPFPMGPGPGGPGLPPNLPPGMPPHAFFAAMNGMPPPPGMPFGFPEGLMEGGRGSGGRGGPPGPPPGFPQYAELQQQDGRERRQGPPPGL